MKHEPAVNVLDARHLNHATKSIESNAHLDLPWRPHRSNHIAFPCNNHILRCNLWMTSANTRMHPCREPVMVELISINYITIS